MTEFTLQPPVANELTLLHELNHRVDNEFASAINLVAVAAVRSDNPEVKIALGNVVELLHEHASVLRSLKIPDDDALIDAAEYLGRLCFWMSQSKLDRMNIRLLFAADALLLQSGRCWQLGMMLYELVTNAARHACFDGRDGEIRVEFLRKDALVKCRVWDNGSASTGTKPGRGLRLLDDLSRSLGGRVYHSFGAEGAYCALVFPFTEREQPANRMTAAVSHRAGLKGRREHVRQYVSVA